MAPIMTLIMARCTMAIPTQAATDAAVIMEYGNGKSFSRESLFTAGTGKRPAGPHRLFRSAPCAKNIAPWTPQDAAKENGWPCKTAFTKRRQEMNDSIQTDFAPITNETLIELFRRASHFMARAYHRQGHAQHAQRHILAILDEREFMNQRDLMERLGVRSASLSELLGKLERSGHIVRERDEADRRNFVITPTEQGKAAAAGQDEEQRESAGALFEALSGEERQRLGELLIKIIVDMEEKFPDLKSCRRPDHDGHQDCPHGRGRHGRGRHPHHGPGEGHRHEGMECLGHGRPGHGRHRAGREEEGEK